MQNSSSICICFVFKENFALFMVWKSRVQSWVKMLHAHSIPSNLEGIGHRDNSSICHPWCLRNPTFPTQGRAEAQQQTDCSRFCFLSTSTEKASSRHSTSSSCSTLLCCEFVSAPACAPAASQLSTNTHKAGVESKGHSWGCAGRAMAVKAPGTHRVIAGSETSTV